MLISIFKIKLDTPVRGHLSSFTIQISVLLITVSSNRKINTPIEIKVFYFFKYWLKKAITLFTTGSCTQYSPPCLAPFIT